MTENNYITLDKLEVYKLSRIYSSEAWKIYKPLNWQERKIIGDQMIESVDSVGANIAEGYGRFHYADKNKFYYNARGSLLESKHWIELMFEREFINEDIFKKITSTYKTIEINLNLLIASQRDQKNNA